MGPVCACTRLYACLLPEPSFALPEPTFLPERGGHSCSRGGKPQYTGGLVCPCPDSQESPSFLYPGLVPAPAHFGMPRVDPRSWNPCPLASLPSHPLFYSPLGWAPELQPTRSPFLHSLPQAPRWYKHMSRGWCCQGGGTSPPHRHVMSLLSHLSSLEQRGQQLRAGGGSWCA